jgi:hypothetical protein
LGARAKEPDSRNLFGALQTRHTQVKDRERHVLIFEVVDDLGEAISLEKSLYLQGPAKEVHKAHTEDRMIVSD